jgi:hypothetical protein
MTKKKIKIDEEFIEFEDEETVIVCRRLEVALKKFDSLAPLLDELTKGLSLLSVEDSWVSVTRTSDKAKPELTLFLEVFGERNPTVEEFKQFKEEAKEDEEAILEQTRRSISRIFEEYPELRKEFTA